MVSNYLSLDSGSSIAFQKKIEDFLGLDHASLAFRTKQVGLVALSLIALFGVREAIQYSFMSNPAIAVPLCVAPFALLFFALSMSDGINGKNREENGPISLV